MSDPPASPHPEAALNGGRRLQLIWLIPIVAALIAGYLGWRGYDERGPLVTISFRTAAGLQSGQTRVRHKAVDLGTVQSVVLGKDRANVLVRVRMRREATPYLTDNARFWIVRPRLSAGDISGLETLLSGAYIELDPGAEGAPERLEFTGLEEPPAVRSDEPGRTFKLRTSDLGSISSGSLVFYRDIVAGEVLGYDLGAEGEDLTITAFVRSPFDAYVHTGTRFWKAAGISVDFGANGVNLHMTSLQALLSGGIAFDTVPEALTTPKAKQSTVFTLYPDASGAASAGYRQRLPFLVYFNGSVAGLAVGAPVEALGIQIGNVTGIKLRFNPASGEPPLAEVRIEVQPERFMHEDPDQTARILEITSALVDKGMRAQLHTASFLTGQLLVGLDFIDGAPAGAARMEDGLVVIPSVGGGLEGITANITRISQRLADLPLEQIGARLNDALANVDELAHSRELRQSLEALAATLATTREIVRKVDAGVGPAMASLPGLSRSLQDAVNRTGKLVGSAETGYGADSSFRRNLDRLMGQVSDAARSLRQLTDYLEAHPEALVRGRPEEK
jgi:paraquat-inducible protein B